MLIRKIDAFLRRTRMPESKFGRLSARDPRLVSDLRKGRVLRPATERRLEHFMNTYPESPHAC